MFFKFRAPLAMPAALVLAIAGCSWTPPAAPQAGPDPADVNAQIRPVTDIGVTGAYQSFRPVEPQSWREQNERVAPPARP